MDHGARSGGRADAPETEYQTPIHQVHTTFARPRPFEKLCPPKLGSAASKRTYGAAIEDFISWYCSEPRLAFGRTVVLRYRYELESRRLAPATINLRLAAVRRLAYEASDNGLLNPELAAGIRRVKGAKRLGMRLGNWLTIEQSRKLLSIPDSGSTKDKRDRAILSLLLGCGLRRAELTGLRLTDFQQRDEHWAIVNLFGNGGHIRTVPVPGVGKNGS
jgi:integrase